MKRWYKWIGESLTYRLEDFFGAFIASSLVIWFISGEWTLGIEGGLTAALTENILASAWYLLNRKLWSRIKESDSK